MKSELLNVTEIFRSLQGECRSSGWPTTFVRLTGCPLRCSYCDTEYAFHGGEKMSVDSILAKVVEFRNRRVTITGGEPLIQKGVYSLMRKLCDDGYEVSLETGGMLPVSEVDERVERVIDLKTPGSGEVDSNCWDNIAELNSKDQLKIVVKDRADYEWLLPLLTEHDLEQRCDVLLSAVAGELSPTKLAGWIIEDELDVRLQLQLHKILWGDEQGR
ncbi:MAG: 7-carboxy-7-deazaguanine synthase QueE [Thiotrichales bacterium]|nr:7-carboxy-7-deazaguanine synthase QueE [Thiotrichales bacterium]MBT3612867.1 7-carboxy-7-deazaguanine synthase QueE [Thiotrichales bacterium]MBT3752749.1 7-carboxy-7-deazaguanine synthase QueE [Thiotrichales bacterium]MBT3836768.1 7-carboxy-7-deazaguanine synthase QueE [Thiotrichales bacterium]MBT4152402.1 7-carboxy-7-deazaguanine synthase QueE [Thiotrichales bacterium]